MIALGLFTVILIGYTILYFKKDINQMNLNHLSYLQK